MPIVKQKLNLDMERVYIDVRDTQLMESLLRHLVSQTIFALLQILEQFLNRGL